MKPKTKTAFKSITMIMAAIYLVVLSTYSSMLIGTLAHELMHKRYAIETTAIEVNYGGSGVHKGATFTHPHEWVYLNGNIVFTVLLGMTIASIFILMFGRLEYEIL